MTAPGCNLQFSMVNFQFAMHLVMEGGLANCEEVNASASRLVSRVLSSAEADDGHFSSRPVARAVQQPTRKSSWAGPALLPYLALLPAGFAEPACRQAAGGLLH
jgi:hypothetical protein